MISRVCNNFNDLSFRKTENSDGNIDKNLSTINEKCQNQKQQQKYLGININLFNAENNSFLNSLKSLQNSISCSFTQQEKTISSLINKTKEFIPTFYISNNNNNNNTLNSINQANILSHKATSLISTTTSYPVIKININPSISYYQPCNYYQDLISSISNTHSLSLNHNNVNLRCNNISYPSLPLSFPINKTLNKIKTFNDINNINNNINNNDNNINNNNINNNDNNINNNNINNNDNNINNNKINNNNNINNNDNNINNNKINNNNNINNNDNNINNNNDNNINNNNINNNNDNINHLSYNNNNNLSNILITSSSHISTNNSISSSILSNSLTTNLSNSNEEMAIDGDDEMDEDENDSSIHSRCTCQQIGSIPKSSSHSYKIKNKNLYKKSFKERHQIISDRENGVKEEHKRNYVEGKKIERLLEDCVKKSNEAKQIQPNEFLYSTTSSNHKSSNDSNISSNSSKRSITVKITLIHLGIILCMTRLIYYVLKYCKLCYRVQNCADDVSTKLREIRNDMKKDNSFCLFKESAESTLPSSESNPSDIDNYHYNKESSSLTSVSIPASSPSLSSSNILTPVSSSNDSLPISVHHNNDTQLQAKTVKTKRRANYIKIIDQGDTIGNTPLHYATIAHSPALFNMLIE
ncbi:hypothetical protein PIROE2DRAFT_16161, partial [Piromyces sp. E2]